VGKAPRVEIDEPMNGGPPGARTARGAALYESDEDLLARVLAFLRNGLVHRESVVAVLS
jgi:hypothetical protein